MSFWLPFEELPYGLNYLCFFYKFIAAVRTALLVAAVEFPTAGTFRFISFLKLVSAEWAFHKLTPSSFNRLFTIKPVTNANGKMKPEIARAVLKPLSFIVIMNWAIQGMKRVRVMAATTS